MKRSTFNTVIGENTTRFVSRLVTEQCERESQMGLYLKHELLERIALQPDLTLCGTMRFHQLRVFHDGTTWIAEAEAVVQTDPET